MKRRALLVLTCVILLLVLVVPVARAVEPVDLDFIDPGGGTSGQLLRCTVGGSFFYPIVPPVYTPQFSLSNGPTTIFGDTVAVYAGGTRATVDFFIPVDAPSARYYLYAEQQVVPMTYYASLPRAFAVQQGPVITGLEPPIVTAGAADLKLVVKGANFINILMPLPQSSIVEVNGTPVATQFESDVRLTATVPAALLGMPGTARVTVVNTGTKSIPEVRSNVFDLFVKPPSAPTVTACTPASAWAGYVKNDVVLTVTGSNFVNGSHIMFGATEKTNTTFVSGTQLQVPLTAADLATAGTVAVGVKSPPSSMSATTVPFSVQQETTLPAVTISGATDGGWYNAPVALAFAATDTQSGVQKVQYMAPPAVPAWTDGTSYTVPAVDGPVTVSAQAVDWCNQTGSATVTVHIDTSKPGTQTLGDVTVKKGKTATLRFRVTEPANGSPTVSVTIKIAKSNGKVVKTIPIANVPVNSDRSQSFQCNLAKATYTWSVEATDLAGNQQANIATAKLKVK